MELASAIKSCAKAVELRRYKLVCNVLILENKGQSTIIVSRALADAKTDSMATYTFKNSSLISVAMVYGLYFE